MAGRGRGMTLPAWMTKEGGEQPAAQAPPAPGGLNGKNGCEGDYRNMRGRKWDFCGVVPNPRSWLARVDSTFVRGSHVPYSSLSPAAFRELPTPWIFDHQ